MLVEAGVIEARVQNWAFHHTSLCSRGAGLGEKTVPFDDPRRRSWKRLLLLTWGLKEVVPPSTGHRRKGIWSFWLEGTPMDMDENDVDFWRSWESQSVQDLSLALPDEWLMFFPINIAPELVMII